MIRMQSMISVVISSAASAATSGGTPENGSPCVPYTLHAPGATPDGPGSHLQTILARGARKGIQVPVHRGRQHRPRAAPVLGRRMVGPATT